MSQYIPTIGIECHVQLKTKTKLFAAVENDAREAEPNTLISHICLGMPGALPVLNQAAVDLSIKAAFALNTTPQKFSAFDRKHYFYPDLPKGYQISQLYHPIILGGHIDIQVDGQAKRIGVTRAHMEEDAGKSTHPAGKDYSLVDLNRAGTPLLEIVSEPDIHTAAEAKAYARELYLLMRYAEVSDANLYYGNMRFDVNVSVSKSDGLGIRTETKNLNSFRSVERAVEFEIKRQIEVLESGGSITQETRGWDDSKQETFSQRSKEDAHDYRYFPDPDIPPIVLSEEQIEATKSTMPLMPAEIRSRLMDLKLNQSTIETLVEEINPAKIVLKAQVQGAKDDELRKIALWLAGDVQGYIANEDNLGWESIDLDTESLIELAKLTSEAKVSSTGAKSILGELVKSGGNVEEIAKRLDVLQVSDTGELEKIIDEVIAQNEKAANDIKAGEMKAIGFLVGQVMKASKGKANPGVVQKIIKDKLS